MVGDIVLFSEMLPQLTITTESIIIDIRTDAFTTLVPMWRLKYRPVY
jgi:hypothetical protein